MKIISSSLVCLVLSAFVVACQEKPQPATTMLVDIVEVEGNAIAQHAEYPGQTEAQDVTNLSFRVMGIIDKVLVKEGDRLTKGQPVARMDSRDYYTQSPYAAYFYGDQALTRVHNELCENGRRVLVLGHSFDNCVLPFLALGVEYLDSIDPREFTGSVETFLRENWYDVVIEVFTE